MTGETVPRASKISLEEDDEEEGLKVLYSDRTYIEDISLRRVIAYARSNSAEASTVELEAESYEEVSYQMGTKTCYKWQKLNNFSHFLYDTFFYSAYTVENCISKKKGELYIESSLVSAEIFARAHHLGFRHQRRHKVEFIFDKHFHLLV